jgi:PTH1 family peptidyl-tRNA hydrolase
MNNSGIAVQEILVQFDIELQDILVIFDDFHLPLGNIRLRASGSSGGHNGIASIIWHLQTHEFPRLRCGIGSERKPKDKQATAEFVLSPFAAEELESVNGMVLNARDAAIIVAQENLQAALNHISKAIR